ncbi:MAG: hypothetical protein CMJ18_15590 [Phycisphaeraceae bacterium]|nr:hypothetical protein [Phycisphaeraceae bacterium]
MYFYRQKIRDIPGEWSFRDYVLELAEATPETRFFEYHGYRLGASEYVLGANGEIIIDFIAKYENRSRDIRRISSRLNLDDFGSLRIQGARPDESGYSGFYDSETREIIRRRYAKDIELFDYEFDGQS